MRIKSFTGKSVSDAMNKVRQELGEDAIILSTQEIDNGEAQVTAAIEKKDPPAPTVRVKANNGWAADWDADWKQETAPKKTAMPKAKPAPKSPKPKAAQKAEPPKEHIPLTPTVETLVQAMAYHGVPTLLAERVCRTALSEPTDDITMALAASLDQHFRFAPQFSRKNVPVMLIGPPGVGKTMTIAKMAASAKLRGRDVHVITADRSRAGAVEQLKSFTDILDLKLWVVDTPQELKELLKKPEFHDGSHTLIDSGGISCYDEDELARLAELIIAANAEAIVVLAAGTDSAEMSDTAKRFASIGGNRLIVTRLDTTRRYGGVLTAADTANLSFSYASVSPSVAKGLHALNPVNLARLILRDPAEQNVSSEFNEAEK